MENGDGVGGHSFKPGVFVRETIDGQRIGLTDDRGTGDEAQCGRNLFHSSILSHEIVLLMPTKASIIKPPRGAFSSST
jgi:hypothetical protein